MTEKERKPDYRGLRRAKLIGRHANGAAITEHALLFRPESTPEGIEPTGKEEAVETGGWHPFPPGTVFDIRNVPGNAEIIRQRQEEITRGIEGRLPEETNENSKEGEQ